MTTTSGPQEVHGLKNVTDLPGITIPLVSVGENGRIYFDRALGRFRVSEDGGAYVDMISAPGASTLQDSYDGGSTVVLGANGAVVLNKGTVDATNAFEVNVSAGTGAAILRTGFDEYLALGAPPVLSIANSARIYYDGVDDELLISEDGGAYESLRSGGKVSNLWTAATNLLQGEVVYISGTIAVDQADATSNVAASSAFGFVVPTAGIGSGTSGAIVTDGVITILFVASLSLTAGDDVFLSLVAGSATNDITAFVAGNVVLKLGKIRSPLTYNGAGDLLAEIEIDLGTKLVL